MGQTNSNRKVERRAFVLLLVVLIIASVVVIYPFLNTVLIAGVLAMLFFPLHRKYLKWTKKSQNIASGLSVLSVITLFLIPVGVLVALLTAQLAALVQKLPQDMGTQNVSGLLSNWEGYVTPWIEKLEAMLGVEINVIEMVSRGIRWLGQAIAQYSPSVVAETAGVIINLIVMLIILFYFFRDGPRLIEKLIVLSPIKDRFERELASEIENTVYGIFYGSFLTGAIQGLLATIAYYIAKVPGALVWGVLTFFFSFIPLVGTGAVIIPIIIYLIIQGEYGYAAFLAVYGAVVIGSSDNFLRPMLIRTHVHQALIFLSLFGGLAVFGPMGILIGPVVMALLTGTIKIYEDNYL